MSETRQQSKAEPVAESARITSLDLIRGVAVLGILLMNVVHFKFGRTPYLNLRRAVRPGELVTKFMGIFRCSGWRNGILLFGLERAEARGGRPVC